MTEQRSLPADAIAALENGDTIGAIKLVRTTFGLGLKEAKDMVDAHLANAPELAARVRSVSSERSRQFLLRLALFAAAAAVLYYYLTAGS